MLPADLFVYLNFLTFFLSFVFPGEYHLFGYDLGDQHQGRWEPRFRLDKRYDAAAKPLHRKQHHPATNSGGKSRHESIIEASIPIESNSDVQRWVPGRLLPAEIGCIKEVGGVFGRRLALLRYKVMQSTVAAIEAFDDFLSMAGDKRWWVTLPFDYLLANSD